MEEVQNALTTASTQEKRDQRLNPEKYGKAKAYKKKRKSDAFWQSDLLAGRGQKLQRQGPEEGELDPKCYGNLRG